MIDRRELLEKSRQKGINLMMVEKDYVLGWLLFGFAKFRNLIFKGRTALSKIYFPKIWRLSEDLDFSLLVGELRTLLDKPDAVFSEVGRRSGIGFNLKSSHINPDYLQLKIQYQGIIGKNWIKVDVTKNDLVEKPLLKPIHRAYSDYPAFRVRVESPEEIFSSKLRAIIERKKCRDYFDLWHLSKMKFDEQQIKRTFMAKCAIKKIEFKGKRQLFPDSLQETLKPYWERELGRLINPVPDMKVVLDDLKDALKLL